MLRTDLESWKTYAVEKIHFTSRWYSLGLVLITYMRPIPSLKNLFVYNNTTYHERNLDLNCKVRPMIPTLVRLLCARQKSFFVKEANEDANYRAGLLPGTVCPRTVQHRTKWERRRERERERGEGTTDVWIGRRTMPQSGGPHQRPDVTAMGCWDG